MTLQEAIAEVKRLADSEFNAEIPSMPRYAQTILNAVASGDLIPASDARLAVALAYQRAVEAVPQGWCAATTSHKEMDVDLVLAIQAAILALATTDALAELNALRAERDALREARIAFQNVDCQVEDEGEFTERAWAQLRAALQPTTQAQEGEG